jgi:hypothetical protein
MELEVGSPGPRERNGRGTSYRESLQQRVPQEGARTVPSIVLGQTTERIVRETGLCNPGYHVLTTRQPELPQVEHCI